LIPTGVIYDRVIEALHKINLYKEVLEIQPAVSYNKGHAESKLGIAVKALGYL
jgi:hypothetical protein